MNKNKSNLSKKNEYQPKTYSYIEMVILDTLYEHGELRSLIEKENLSPEQFSSSINKIKAELSENIISLYPFYTKEHLDELVSNGIYTIEEMDNLINQLEH